MWWLEIDSPSNERKVKTDGKNGLKGINIADRISKSLFNIHKDIGVNDN